MAHDPYDLPHYSQHRTPLVDANDAVVRQKRWPHPAVMQRLRHPGAGRVILLAKRVEAHKLLVKCLQDVAPHAELLAGVDGIGAQFRLQDAALHDGAHGKDVDRQNSRTVFSTDEIIALLKHAVSNIIKIDEESAHVCRRSQPERPSDPTIVDSSNDVHGLTTGLEASLPDINSLAGVLQ